MGLLNTATDKWKSLSSVKKSVSIVVITSLILSSYLFYRWATKVEYAPLFTNVQADSAGKIVEGLKGMNIPYSLDDGGSTILVPKDQVYELRLNFASKGVLPEGGLGFELFDKSDMGATDFERNVNYQRALQEELRRTISQIDAVKQARVHLVLPEKSAFIENEHKAQASIVLELKPMVKLQPEQVKGISELVAGSVENLNIEDVNIIDTAGHILSDNIKNDGNSALELNQLDLKRNFEKSIESRIQQLLDSIYGPNKAVTMITADLDFNQKEVSRIVWGKEGVVTSEQLNQKTTSTDNSSPAPVGDSNRDPSLTNTAGSNNDISSTKNYEIDKVEEKEIYAPGRLKSLSTAVAINGELPPDAEIRIREIISAAIGFNAARGDTINVLSTEFDESSLDEAKAEMAKIETEENKKENINTWMSWGLKGIGIILFFVLGLALIRVLGSRHDSSDIILQQPASIKKVEEQLEQMEIRNSESYVSEDEEIKKILKDQPEVAAQIITTWLEENGSGVSG